MLEKFIYLGRLFFIQVLKLHQRITELEKYNTVDVHKKIDTLIKENADLNEKVRVLYIKCIFFLHIYVIVYLKIALYCIIFRFLVKSFMCLLKGFFYAHSNEIKLSKIRDLPCYYISLFV